LSYWYGFDVSSLSKSKQAGLLANLPKLQAQETIHRGNYDSLDYEQVHKLFAAAYDERTADTARLKSLKLLVRHETEAARHARKT
jgi:hypothetical protein